MVEPSKNIPTVIVAFGATGDLMRLKVVPALFYLFKKGELPRMFRVVGFSRRDMDDEQFREYVKEMIEKHEGGKIENTIVAPFLAMFRFQRGHFDDRKSYEALQKTVAQSDKEWGVCANKLFYLAVAPEFYENIFKHLSGSGLTDPCSPEEGWTRVIVEKPFGTDLLTAKNLDELLAALFKEEQIYRIDHYLAKEMLQNILNFRFSNNLFEIAWGNKLIERIHIRVLESIGVEKRGVFYDAIGAFRDVGQNHFLQMLALVTMEHPETFDARAIQARRAEILSALELIVTSEAKSATFRAQYEGYRGIPGVAPDSQTETYFKVRASLSDPSWQGVPIILEGGKRLGEALKEIVITFKHPSPCLCPPNSLHHKNEVIIRLEPKEEILIEFWSKKPGLGMETEKRMFHFLLRERLANTQYIEEYAKLLLDCIFGDQTLFISTEEIRAMWRFADPILDAWKKDLVPLAHYAPDSRVASEVSAYVEERGLMSSAYGKKEIGIVGLGKMGANISRRLMENGWSVYGVDANRATVQQLEKEGMKSASDLRELSQKLTKVRLIWLMVPAGHAVDEVLFGKNGLAANLSHGDVIIDGGNSYYKDSVARAKKLSKRGIHFIDVGFSGGPYGARSGASLMVGGERKLFEKYIGLFHDLAHQGGYQFFEGAGAGHFIKMVHNGIEYGMMQAIAEGFAILKKSKYKLDLTKVADIYNNGSVVESRLIAWLQKAFQLHGEDLKNVSPTVAHTGEGEWTVKAAKEEKVIAKIIEESLKFRIKSAKNPSYTGKILSALREQFGGHRSK